MNVSPLDLRQQRFRKTFRGFDPVEVTARSWPPSPTTTSRRCAKPTGSARTCMRMEAMLTEHREHEKNLKNTLMTAQKLADDIKAQRRARSAAHHPRGAKGAPTLLLDKTQARLEDIQREIDGLKLKRKDAETSIEATIQTLRNTLDFVREQEARERETRSCCTGRGRRRDVAKPTPACKVVE